MNTIADFIPPILVAQGAFWLMVFITLTGAILAVIPSKIVHNILGLAQAMFGVAGIYLFLGSQFVAMMQLLIYVGAICVTYIFGIMLSPPLELDLKKQSKLKAATAFIVSVIGFLVIIQMITQAHWPPYAAPARDWTAKTLGHALLTRYFLVFELISLLLAVAIVGAILIVDRGWYLIGGPGHKRK
jgi:NADH:ubiquinone oxidoreductase subunit 6 (subunit J)